MIRNDIQVNTISPILADITTNKNSFSLHVSDVDPWISSTAKLPMQALDDIEKSHIVTIEHYQVTEQGNVLFQITKRFGFTLEKFVDVMVFIIEKYNL